MYYLHFVRFKYFSYFCQRSRCDFLKQIFQNNINNYVDALVKIQMEWSSSIKTILILFNCNFSCLLVETASIFVIIN